jgi:signal transduction histidine kinase
LALWAACRAAESRETPPRTLDELTAWLAAAALGEFSRQLNPEPRVQQELDKPATSCSAETLGAWADLAARSLSVARLAEQLARSRNLDAPGAYFLGLLHAAPAWLAASAREGSGPQPRDVLPHWLQDALSRIDAAGPGDASSPADCVALAIPWSADTADRQPRDFPFDFAAHALSIDAPRRDWLQPAHPRQWQCLVSKLARLEKLTRQFQQTLEAEKLESLKELAYGAGHEINNPLANISARAQTLLPAERDPDRRRMLAAIHTQAVRAHEMIADMMLFARPPRPKFASVDLVELLGGLVSELTPQAAQQQSELLFEAPASPVTVWADPTQIAVAVRALCGNALEALVTGGWVAIALAKSTPTHDTAQITVSDNGPGISIEGRPHIFDPFYSGREAGRGLGFGLSKCWRIVTMHGGSVAVESAPGAGARFTITLPHSAIR